MKKLVMMTLLTLSVSSSAFSAGKYGYTLPSESAVANAARVTASKTAKAAKNVTNKAKDAAKEARDVAKEAADKAKDLAKNLPNGKELAQQVKDHAKEASDALKRNDFGAVHAATSKAQSVLNSIEGMMKK